MIVNANTGDPDQEPGDARVELVYEEPDLSPVLRRLDEIVDGSVRELISSGEMKGKTHEAHVLLTNRLLPTRRLLLLGAGKRAEMTPERIGRLSGQAAREANHRGWETLVLGGTLLDAMSAGDGSTATPGVRAAIAATMIAPMKWDPFKTGDRFELKLKTIRLPRPEDGNWEKEAQVGEALGEGINLAREMVILPPSDMTPAILAERARSLGETMSFHTTILDRAALEEMGAGALLAVSRGSVQEPRMIWLRYGDFPGKPVVGLVGKGLTFDSGGLCIKQPDHMADMKTDMAGAASVLGAMHAIGRLQPEINVVAVCPASENTVGPDAYRPGDVVRTLGGKTIEILNTDAEGRVILADGLAYAQQSGATHLVDLATLTGACVVALGTVCTGVMGDPQDWIDRILTCAREAGETMWQLPLLDDYKELIKSDIADVENSGGRSAGAQTGALLLKEFVKNGVPWAHLDIAGTAWSDSATAYSEKGATGVAIRTLIRLVESMASEAAAT